MRKREDGFTLIEIVVTLVLVGILSAFVGLFMTTFMKGYFMVKNNSDTAMKAQMALDRISLELRDATAVSVLTDNSLITYKNTQIDPLGVDRTIKFVGSAIYLSTSADNILIDNVQRSDANPPFKLSATYRNVYNIAADDVAFIDIEFSVTGNNNPFSTRIFPRTRIPHL